MRRNILLKNCRHNYGLTSSFPRYRQQHTRPSKDLNHTDCYTSSNAPLHRSITTNAYSSSGFAIILQAKCSVAGVKRRKLSHQQIRCQHTQAVEDDYDADEATLVEAFKILGDVKEQKDHRGNLNPDGGDDGDELLKTDIEQRQKPSERLLEFISRFAPQAVPFIRFHENGAENVGEEFDQTTRTVNIEIGHDEYGISCIQDVICFDQDHKSLDSVFEALAQDYMQKVMEYLDLKNIHNDDVQPYPTRNLYDYWGMEQVAFHRSPIKLPGNNANHRFLIRAEVRSGKELLGQPQIWTTSRIASRFARASADAEILRRTEDAGLDLKDLRRTFAPPGPAAQPSKKKRGTEIPRASPKDTPRTYNMSISSDCLAAILHTLGNLRRRGIPDEHALKPFEPSPPPPAPGGLSIEMMNVRSQTLKTQYQSRLNDPAHQAILHERKKLPIRKPKPSKRVRELIKNNDVVVLVSETGSGKTTQLPQILLEEAIREDRGAYTNIICTQPRRIAATSVAARVAHEWGTALKDTVGYEIRFDNMKPVEPGHINYATAGILLKQLQDNADSILQGFSHIVIDEVHERDLTVDLLIAWLRSEMRIRKAQGKHFPKLILMSATMSSGDFEKYFAKPGDDHNPSVASINVSGRAFPIEARTLDNIIPLLSGLYQNDHEMMQLLRRSQEYLKWEDEFAEKWDKYQSTDFPTNDITEKPLPPTVPDPFRDDVIPFGLITATVAHVLKTNDEGDILVFLPGMKELDVLADMLLTKSPTALGFSDEEKLKIFKLHSVLYETNGKVFQPIPPGCRRIILATNIAQTSVTLPNVVHVIDSGKQRRMSYDHVSARNEFATGWIDRASSLQRRGRAGRVQNGYYWAMFSDARWESMPEQSRPDILTSQLTASSLLLKSSSNQIKLQDFYASGLSVPDTNTTSKCLEELYKLGMLVDEEQVTPLGKFCAEFPLHPAKARGLLLGLLFRCFTPMLILAAHDQQSPLINSATNRREMYHSTLTFASTSDDDRYAFVKAFLAYEEAVQSKSKEAINALEQKHVKREAYSAILTVSRQLYGVVADYDLLPERPLDSIGKTASVYSIIPKRLDTYSNNLNLFKALALSASSSNLAVWEEEEESWLVEDVMCMIRPYSVNTMYSLKLLERPAYRKTGELADFSVMIRNVISGPRPFLAELSTITPLMAMLFGGPTELVDENTIEIDGWLRYKISVATDSNQVEDSDLVTKSPARVVMEFRKALDRYLIHCFSDLRNVARMTRQQKQDGQYNSHFDNSDLGREMTQGLIRILDLDADHWDEVIHST